MGIFSKKDDGKKPLVTKTTKVSPRKNPAGEPRKEKAVERVYGDYPLQRKNLLKKTTVVRKNNNAGDKTIERKKTITNPLVSDYKTVEKSRMVKDLTKGTTKEKNVSYDKTGMFNPLGGSSRRNRTVTKSFKNNTK